MLKNYSARRFSFNATALSSQEFLRQLPTEAELQDRDTELLQQMLDQADAAKFARAEFSGEIISTSLDSAVEFIQNTRPAEEVPK